MNNNHISTGQHCTALSIRYSNEQPAISYALLDGHDVTTTVPPGINRKSSGRSWDRTTNSQ